MMTDQHHDPGVIKIIHHYFPLFAISGLISSFTLINSFVRDNGGMHLWGVLTLCVYMAANFVNEVFGDKIGRVVEWGTITGSTAMMMVEIPIHCDVYIASFIRGPTMQYVTKAGGASLDQKWRTSTWM